MSFISIPIGNQTLIKRTFYQESIISGTNVDMPQIEKLLGSQASPQSTTTFATKSSSTTKLTTRVTLNMRQFKRRSSDVGLIGTQEQAQCSSPRMPDVRHSVCGPQIVGLTSQNVCQELEVTSGRSLEHFTKYRPGNDADASFAASPMHSLDSQLQLSNADVSRVRAQTAKVVLD